MIRRFIKNVAGWATGILSFTPIENFQRIPLWVAIVLSVLVTAVITLLMMVVLSMLI